ncbi:MAG: hypothetical protein O9306_16485 [Beijerinckiaceae bacterium]|jgi:hypothetical protein|nr:hypothetical protein [Beijerinckiaceae bacterium]
MKSTKQLKNIINWSSFGIKEHSLRYMQEQHNFIHPFSKLWYAVHKFKLEQYTNISLLSHVLNPVLRKIRVFVKEIRDKINLNLNLFKKRKETILFHMIAGSGARISILQTENCIFLRILEIDGVLNFILKENAIETAILSIDSALKTIENNNVVKENSWLMFDSRIKNNSLYLHYYNKYFFISKEKLTVKLKYRVTKDNLLSARIGLCSLVKAE